MFKTPYQDFIFLRTYARYLDRKGRRETWEETVKRYHDCMVKRVPDGKREEFQRATAGILNLDVMPSMRALWTAGGPGSALEHDNICAYNCSYLAIDTPKAFADLLYILMNGTGVGFTVERQVINALPVVPEKFVEATDAIVFEDSKLGWAEGYLEVLNALFGGTIPTCDFSRVRPAGARLKTFGGRASGPEPLKQLVDYTIGIFKAAAGRKLTSLECHDICCYIAQIVVVGGVRRSACISLSNLSDERMRHAKDGQFWEVNPQRALANNSVAYTEKPDSATFLREWESLVRSNSGERGIFNRVAAQLSAGSTGRRSREYSFGVNPCAEVVLRPKQFCVSGDTKLMTKNGVGKIRDMVGPRTIWNGKRWSDVEVYKTSDADMLYRVTFRDGSFLDVNESHRFRIRDRFSTKWKVVNTLELMDGISKWKHPVHVPDPCVEHPGGHHEEYAYEYGVFKGDGYMNTTPHVDLFGDKIALSVRGCRREEKTKPGYGVPSVTVRLPFLDKRLSKRLKDKGLPDELFTWDAVSLVKFFSGWADTDGSYASKGIRIYSDEDSIRDGQLLLTKLGVKSSVNKMSDAGTETNYGKRSYAIWYLQITKTDWMCTQRLTKLNPEGARFKGKNTVIKSVVPLDKIGDTYCLTDTDTGECLFGNVLTPQCNLSECVIRPDDTLDDLRRKVRQATILGIVQSKLTKFKFLDREWKRNCEEERLLGVSLTGLRDHPVLGRVSSQAKVWLTAMKQVALETSREWSEALGISMPAAVTTVKPSGTVSQLVDSASGIHPRYAPAYIRRVRVSASDPLAQMLADQGVPWEPEVGQTRESCTIKVFAFPILAPEDAVFRDEVSAIEQLEYWLMLKTYWAEHSVSATIYVNDSEWVGVGAWVYSHWDQITGLTFLPSDGGVYPLAPYEEIDVTRAKALIETFPTLDFTALPSYEAEDKTQGSREFACTAGGCEL